MAGWMAGVEGSRKHGGRVKKSGFPFKKKRGGEGVTPGFHISNIFFISVQFPISLGTYIYDNIFYIILLPIVYLLIPILYPI
jgi:hypothetical protein